MELTRLFLGLKAQKISSSDFTSKWEWRVCCPGRVRSGSLPGAGDFGRQGEVSDALPDLPDLEHGPLLAFPL